MPYVPIALPPGFYRNGTDTQAAGRWRDGSLVRWADGAMQPVGGWTRLGSDDLGAAARGGLAWRDNSGNRWAAFGTYNGLFAVDGDGEVYNITPVGPSASPLPQTDIYTDATTWSFGSWGQYLIACSSAEGKIYEWQLNDAVLPAQIGAPTGNRAIVVTAERFIFALGSGGNPRKVAWCDQGDNTTWTASATNQAGDQELETNSEIIAGVSVRGQTLILTRDEAFAATYLGPPFVYGFERVGVGCGAISGQAAAQADGGAMWMGARGFHAYNGGEVIDVPCDVADYVFRELNDEHHSKVHAVSNARFNEVWWFYPQGSECDSYVAYNTVQKTWTIGSIDRTCGVDRGAFYNPLWVDSDGLIYEHETGTDHDGAAVYAETGPIQFGSDVVSAIKLLPDELTQGEVTATFKTRLYPNGTETSHGPFTMANPTSVRFTGRQVRMRVDAVNDADFRVGTMRLDVRKRGTR